MSRDSLRTAIDRTNELTVRIPHRQARVLLDLADAARKMLPTSDYFDSTASADLRAALDRLDEEGRP